MGSRPRTRGHAPGSDGHRIIQDDDTEHRRHTSRLGSPRSARPPSLPAPSPPQEEEEEGEFLPPSLGSILRGRVVDISPIGAFVELPDCPWAGLVHHSFISDELCISQEEDDATKIKAIEEYCARGATIWVKIIDVQNDKEQLGWKIYCSYKAVDQVTRMDLELEQFLDGILCSDESDEENPSNDEGQLDEEPVAGVVLPTLNSIHEGTVESIHPFGVFVQLDGYSMHVLVHESQISDRLKPFSSAHDDAQRVATISEFAAPACRVWVKIVEIKEDEEGPKVEGSLKLVSQTDGGDLDPQNWLYIHRNGFGSDGIKERICWPTGRKLTKAKAMAGLLDANLERPTRPKKLLKPRYDVRAGAMQKRRGGKQYRALSGVAKHSYTPRILRKQASNPYASGSAHGSLDADVFKPRMSPKPAHAPDAPGHSQAPNDADVFKPRMSPPKPAHAPPAAGQVRPTHNELTPSRGRGRASVLPAWMKGSSAGSTAPGSKLHSPQKERASSPPAHKEGLRSIQEALAVLETRGLKHLIEFGKEKKEERQTKDEKAKEREKESYKKWEGGPSQEAKKSQTGKKKRRKNRDPFRPSDRDVALDPKKHRGRGAAQYEYGIGPPPRGSFKR